MQRALALAERGWGLVHPNPLVGAVVVRGDAVVGEGWHERYGEAHGEIHALRAAGERARGATLYTTLEPCSHHGQTPPCTDAIRAAGIARVVIAAADPNPRAAGGADRLREAGIDVVIGVEAEAARRQNRAFFHKHGARAPFVVLKLAVSLDARIAAAAGERTAITGPEATAAAHELRAGFDAIVVGSGTALVDDPLLTVRLGRIRPRVTPARVVFDSQLRLPTSSRLVQTAGEAPLLVLTRQGADPARVDALGRLGVDIVQLAPDDAGLLLADALDRLARRGLDSLLVEGGRRLAASLLAADRVSRLHLFQAPLLLGPAAVPAFSGAAGRREWVPVRHQRLGRDLHLVLDAD